MSYVVVSYQDRDCSTYYAVRFASEDPLKALAAAKEIKSEKDKWDELFAMYISIYHLETDKLISLADYDNKSEKKPIVYHTFINSERNGWPEIFYGHLRVYNAHPIEEKREYAEKGKFRAIVYTDTSRLQIDKDTNTREDALWLCRNAMLVTPKARSFQVVDDHGDHQVLEDGQLRQLEEA